jgi:hypothetical protein
MQKTPIFNAITAGLLTNGATAAFLVVPQGGTFF